MYTLIIRSSSVAITIAITILLLARTIRHKSLDTCRTVRCSKCSTGTVFVCLLVTHIHMHPSHLSLSLSVCLKCRSLSMSMCLHCPLPKYASDGRAHFPQLFLICLSVCVSVLCRMFDRIGFRPLKFASWFSPIMTCAYVCPAAKTSVCWSNNQRKRRKARDTHTHVRENYVRSHTNTNTQTHIPLRRVAIRIGKFDTITTFTITDTTNTYTNTHTISKQSTRGTD